MNLAKRQLTVARSELKGHVTATKGGRVKHLPLTTRLTDALKEARHLKGARVLCDKHGASAGYERLASPAPSLQPAASRHLHLFLGQRAYLLFSSGDARSRRDGATTARSFITSRSTAG